ncbi:MAG: hypothetical protein KJZ60_13110, partial [Ignavibacteriaceae bacterium]|nr:hypothetical protein [Ignavibacteriaceae bacterium]
LIEGFYNGSTMKPDTVTVELRSTSAPFAIVDQAKIFLSSTGVGSARFYNAVNGVPYYIVLKHRNSIETWSAVPQSFSSNTMIYDFTTGQNKAYGNNLKLIGTKWCIYGGDINQDGFVNATDLNSIYTQNIFGAVGYIPT